MTQPSGSRGGQKVALETWRTDLQRRSSPEHSQSSRVLTVAAVLIVAALLALLVVARLRPGGSDDGAASTETTSPQRATRAGDDRLQAAPALRIHPQRAVAGPPLELDVAGTGCPGTTGTLSITEVGSAADAGGQDRLVVRRQFDVSSDTTFRAAPLLVGQPPGSYRVSIACARFGGPVANDPAAATAERSTFALTEVLELTGPAAAKEFAVSPASATPGLRTQFAVSGAGCDGGGATVEVKVFAPSAMSVGTVAVLRPTVVDGAWRTTHVIADSSATGSYTFEATCTDGTGRSFAYVPRHVQFETAPPPRPRGILGSLLDALDGPPAPKAVPAVGQAVTATPTYTG